jgi:signal transduction histidine kinase/tetratricopeptide (TPR) repeat protein
MTRLDKKLSLLCLLFISSLVCVGQDEKESPLEWYLSFFRTETIQSFEKSLSEKTVVLDEAVETRDLRLEANASLELGLLHLTTSHNIEDAMDHFIRALEIQDSLKLKRVQIITYLGIAQVFEEAGNLKKAEEVLNQASEINRAYSDEQMNVVITNKIGKINALLGHHDTAFGKYEIALKLSKELEDELSQADALFNLAHLHVLKGKYPEALAYFKDALSIRRRNTDKIGESRVLNEIGSLYRLMNNDEKALANHVVALEIRQTLKDKTGIAESYNHIGGVYLEQKNLERAVSNLVLALEAGREAQAQEQILISNDLLSQCYKQAGDFQKALEFRDQYVLVNDFIQHDRSERQLLEIQNRYIIDKKQLEIEKLDSIRIAKEKELATQEKFRQFLIALIALAVAVAVLTIILYIVKQRSTRMLRITNEKVKEQNLQLVELNATKDKFFSIISHDLKGPLNSLTSFSSLLINHTDSLSKDEIKMLAKDLDKSLKNLFALLENLLEWSRSQTGNIEFKPEQFDLAALLQQNSELLSQQAQTKNITIHINNDKPAPVTAHRHSINTVIRNLVSNAIKFTPQAGTITLGVKQDLGLVTVSIADTGVGMTPEVMEKLFRIDTKHTTKGTADEKGTGLGLILCRDFVEKNGGTIWVESNEGKGSVFYFTVPTKRILKNSGVPVLN